MNNCENSVVCFGSKDGSYMRRLIDSIDEGSPVTELNVDFSDFELFSDEVKEIHDVIVDCDSIRVLQLNFRSIYISSANAIFLCQAIERLPRLNELTVCFDTLQIGTKGALVLGKSIQNKGGILTRLKFDLEYSMIGFEGISALSDGIISNSKQLRFLSLMLGSNKVTDEMINILGNTISQCNQLEELELDLKQNFICQNAFEELCGSIETCSRIESLALNLSESKNLSNSCMKIIGKLIKAFAMQLKSLGMNLKQNLYIKTSGIQELYESMKDCSKLEKLSLKLSLNGQGSDGIPWIAKAIESYQYLTELVLMVSWDSMKAGDLSNWIIEAIDSRSLTLRILKLDISNHINQIRMKELLQSIQKCKYLLYLALSTNYYKVEQLLRPSKSNLYKLKYLTKVYVKCYFDYI